MDLILGVSIGMFLPMLFGFILGVRIGKQLKAKEILEEMSRLKGVDGLYWTCRECGWSQNLQIYKTCSSCQSHRH